VYRREERQAKAASKAMVRGQAKESFLLNTTYPPILAEHSQLQYPESGNNLFVS
jgi:hypothetical protein